MHFGIGLVVSFAEGALKEIFVGEVATAVCVEYLAEGGEFFLVLLNDRSEIIDHLQ